MAAVFGHGAYLGPDFTAQYLHRAVEDMAAFYAGGSEPNAEVRERVKRELKANRYDARAGTLAFTPGQAHCIPKDASNYYRSGSGPGRQQTHLQRPHIADAEGSQVR